MSEQATLGLSRGSSNAWRPWLLVAQIIGTLILSAILARSIDWVRFSQALAELRWQLIALAALMILLSHALCVVRWHGLLPPSPITPWTLIVYYGAGLFSNNFLPTGVGGDGVRAMLTGRHLSLPAALLAVALDRGVGLLGLCFFIVPGLWLGLPEELLERLAKPAALSGSTHAPLFAGVGVVLLIMVTLLLLRGQRILAWAWRKLSGNAGIGPAAGGRTWGVLLLRTYTLSLLSNLVLIGAYWAVLEALTIQVSPGASIWLMVIGSLSMLLPVSINGLGVFESVFVLVLGAYGIPAPPALAGALITRALGMAFSLLGGALSIRAGIRFARGDKTAG